MDRLCKAPARSAQIVLVSRYEDFGFNADQFGAGWEIRRVQQLRDIERMVRGSAPMAGILDLQTPYNDAELAQLEQGLQHLHVMWVAITSTAMLEDERIRRLIRDYCVDYVRTPFSFDELLYTLKHAHGLPAWRALARTDGTRTDDRRMPAHACHVPLAGQGGAQRCPRVHLG